jgi:hypothetical protein
MNRTSGLARKLPQGNLGFRKQSQEQEWFYKEADAGAGPDCRASK